jgi:hypothetical protein
VRVAAFDPGEMSGYAVIEADPSRPREAPRILMSGQCPWWSCFHAILDSAIDRVVVEEFRLFPDKALALIGSEVIGVIRYLAEQGGIRVIGQPALDAKSSFFSDRRLEREGYVDLVGRSSRRHERDAIRQGLHHLHFDLGIDYRRGGRSAGRPHLAG